MYAEPRTMHKKSDSLNLLLSVFKQESLGEEAFLMIFYLIVLSVWKPEEASSCLILCSDMYKHFILAVLLDFTHFHIE